VAVLSSSLAAADFYSPGETSISNNEITPNTWASHADTDLRGGLLSWCLLGLLIFRVIVRVVLLGLLCGSLFWSGLLFLLVILLTLIIALVIFAVRRISLALLGTLFGLRFALL
jgi:hypothetical protein